MSRSHRKKRHFSPLLERSLPALSRHILNLPRNKSQKSKAHHEPKIHPHIVSNYSRRRQLRWLADTRRLSNYLGSSELLMKKLLISLCLAITLITSPIAFNGCKQL